MLKLPFLNFFQYFLDFSGFPDFSPKIGILVQLLPKIPDPETQLTSLNVLIWVLLLCIYH